jgi:hypothetical protein
MSVSTTQKTPAFAAQERTHATMPESACAAFHAARCATQPFRHWLFEDALPMKQCHSILALPISPPEFDDTYGKRDSHNDVRRFFSPAMQAEYPVMRAVAETFQNAQVVQAIEALCGISLTGSFLRIEYCQDKEGFWLEPHMDIKEKHITMQIYLNTDHDADGLGTDMYTPDKTFHSRAPGGINQGMIFLPSEPESWHGFEKRPIAGVRRSLIINYVTTAWRARHELAFPENAIA